MNKFYTYLYITLAGLLTVTHAKGQNNARPNVIVPNGFEVNSYTGNLYHSRADMRVPGRGVNIDITFSYNVSRRVKNWGMGPGWTFTYNMAYSPDSLGLYIERADGKRDLFRKNGSRYIAPAGVYDTLAEYQTGKFLLRTKQGQRYYFDNKAHRRLTRIADAHENNIDIAYQDSLISSVTDNAGHNFQFSWTKGRLTGITDNSCAPARKVSYEYDEAGNPVKVINPLNDFVAYYYDKTNRIVGYTDEMGINMLILYNRSSGVQKVASCATTHTFNYVAQQSKTFVTEKVAGQNMITTYQFDAQGRVINKKGNCCGFNVDYTYDKQNNVTDRKDGMGKSTRFEYDGKGNVKNEIFSDGTSISYTYDATYNKVTSVKDRAGNTTAYQYNAAGDVVQLTKPLGVIEKHTYDAKGNMLTAVNGNNQQTAYQYNASGYLTKTTNAEGGVVQYTYDCHGNRTAETDALGNTTTHQYNALDKLIKTTNALGNTTAYTYDKAGRLTGTTNALGKTTTYTYDGLGRRTAVTSPGGNVTATVYDEQGNISKTIDPNGNATSYSYNSRKQVVSETDALGNSTFYEYDEAGNRIMIKDKKGNATTLAYDENYRVKKVTNALGASVSFTYDIMGNKTAEIDANGNVTQYHYDALQRLVKTTDAAGKFTLSTYDAAGNLITETDKNGNTTRYTYDKLNRIKTVKDALNGISSYTYDAGGNTLTEKNALGHTVTKTYDKLNRPVKELNALNDATGYVYDAAGQVVSVTQPNGQVISNTYDDDGRQLIMADALGTIAGYTYDKNGNKLTGKDGNGNSVSTAYDALNRPVKQTDALGKSTLIAYDAANNVLRQTDRNGNVKGYTYDALNRRLSETDALGNTTKFTYDANGNRLNITDAKGNPTSYIYNNLNQLTRETYADGSSKEYTYDANGNRKTRKDNAGVITTYTYDALNRMTRRGYSTGAADQFTYDAASRRLSANNANATIGFTYDALGRILSETLNGKKIAYTYSTATGTRKITYPGGRVIEEKRDDRERLTTVSEVTGAVATFKYDNGDRLERKTFANSYAENYVYNANNWLTALTCQPDNVINFAYTYDSEGNKLTALKNHRPDNSEKYKYDKLYQLTGFYTGKLTGDVLADTASKSGYAYDALHNRTTSVEDGVIKTYAANRVNAYTKVVTNGTEVFYKYDANGNTTDDGGHTYGYDTDNRLTEVNKGTTARHFYDAMGRRIKTVTATGTTTYFFDGNHFIEERDGNDAVQKTYVYGVWLDDVLSYTHAGKTYYLVNTPQGSVIAALNDNKVAERYEYSGYGEVKYYDGAFNKSNTTLIGNEITFTGRPYLNYQGLYDFRLRNYSNYTGCFYQRDILKYIDGYNLYGAYFIPSNKDPLGMCIKVSLPDFSLKSNPLVRTLLKTVPFLNRVDIVASSSISICNEEQCCNGSKKDLRKAQGSLDIDMTIGAGTFSGEFYGLSYLVGVEGTLSLGVHSSISVGEGCDAPEMKFCADVSLKGALRFGIMFQEKNDQGFLGRFGSAGGVELSSKGQFCFIVNPYGVSIDWINTGWGKLDGTWNFYAGGGIANFEVSGDISELKYLF